MEERLGRVATPAIVVGERVFWGFEDNRREIVDLLGVDIDVDQPESALSPGPEASS